MSNPISESAAHLVGAGMQAMGIRIPVNDTSNRVIDGMRDFGLPVPPKSWFKRSSEDMSRSPKKTIYDKLESHINGVIQVVKPAIQLKNLVRDGCFRSARHSEVPGILSSGDQMNFNASRRSSSGNLYVNSSQGDILNVSLCNECERQRRRRRSTGNIERGEASSVHNNTTLSPHLESHRTPTDVAYLMCSECGKTRDPDIESSMARFAQNTENTTLPEPVDIIDLTQDSPHNTAFRLTTIDTESNIGQRQHEPIVSSRISSNNVNTEPQTRRKKLNKRAVVINLEETINLDDSLNNSNLPKQATAVPVMPNSTRPILSCPICLDNLEGDNLKPMTTPCGHIYCLECLKTITNSKKTCSICKRAIKFSKCIRLHI